MEAKEAAIALEKAREEMNRQQAIFDAAQSHIVDGDTDGTENGGDLPTISEDEEGGLLNSSPEPGQSQAAQTDRQTVDYAEDREHEDDDREHGRDFQNQYWYSLAIGNIYKVTFHSPMGIEYTGRSTSCDRYAQYQSPDMYHRDQPFTPIPIGWCFPGWTKEQQAIARAYTMDHLPPDDEDGSTDEYHPDDDDDNEGNNRVKGGKGRASVTRKRAIKNVVEELPDYLHKTLLGLVDEITGKGSVGVQGYINSLGSKHSKAGRASGQSLEFVREFGEAVSKIGDALSVVLNLSKHTIMLEAGLAGTGMKENNAHNIYLKYFARQPEGSVKGPNGAYIQKLYSGITKGLCRRDYHRCRGGIPVADWGGKKSRLKDEKDRTYDRVSRKG